jgi:hypothetical protein
VDGECRSPRTRRSTRNRRSPRSPEMEHLRLTNRRLHWRVSAILVAHFSAVQEGATRGRFCSLCTVRMSSRRQMNLHLDSGDSAPDGSSQRLGCWQMSTVTLQVITFGRCSASDGFLVRRWNLARARVWSSNHALYALQGNTSVTPVPVSYLLLNG